MVISMTPFLTDSLKSYENVNIGGMGIMNGNALISGPFQNSIDKSRKNIVQ